MIKYLTVLCVAALSACSSGKDNAYPPAELKTFSTEISPDKVWQRDTGNGTHKQYLRLQALVNDSGVYTVSNKGRLSAYDKDTGELNWKVETGIEVLSGVAGGGQNVFTGGLAGDITAFEKKSGDIAWQKTLSSEVMSISEVSNQRVVVRTKDGTISALNAQTGDVVWQVNRQVPDLSLQSQSRPIIYRDVVVIGLDTGRILLLSLESGDVVFEKTIAVGRGRTELDRMVDIDGNFVILNNIAYVVTYQGKIAALDLVTSNILWNREASSVNGLTVDSGYVFYTDDESILWALESHTGSVLWKQDSLLHREGSAPVVIDGNVVVGDYDGYLHWFSIEDAHPRARVRAGKSAILAAPVSYDGKLYVYNSSGVLSVWK